MIHLQITPRDPLVVRDGRPFGPTAGNRMVCLEWPYPSVVAGFIRTWVGKNVYAEHEAPFSPSQVKQLKRLIIGGAYPCIGTRIYFPAPLDVVFFQQKEDERLKGTPLRPQALAEGEGCDLPHPALWPVVVTEDIKPQRGPMFWSRERMIEWLQTDQRGDLSLALNGKNPKRLFDDGDAAPDFLFPLDKDVRVHVKIDPQTGRAQEEQLFTTSGLAFPLGLSIATWLDGLEERQWPTKRAVLAPLGGERRLAYMQRVPSFSWRPDDSLVAALDGAQGLRMVLATPGLFEKGWLPGWIDTKTLQGTPPHMEGLRLQLRGACVGRWKPISGWSMEKGHHGPKPVRRMVPAGSVYFFEVLSGNPGAYIHDAWLRSVADAEQDQRDGFSIALWGLWNR